MHEICAKELPNVCHGERDIQDDRREVGEKMLRLDR